MVDRDLNSIIQDARSGMEFGIVNLALKIHKGELTSVDTSKWSSIKTTNGNTEALTTITELMKAVVKNKESGTLTFAITFVDGNANRIQVQDSKRIS